MLNMPILRWGQPYTSLEAGRRGPLHHRRDARPGEPGQRGPAQPRHAAWRSGRATCSREIPIADLIAMMKKAADLYLDGTLPMGDGKQSPDDFARQQSATHRAARAHVQGQHEEEPLRAVATWTRSSTPHARPGSRHPHARLRRRGARRDRELSGAVAGARPGAAVELAGRAHAVAAGDPDADRAGAQARSAGAVDAVSHGGGVLRGRHAARSDLDLSRRRRYRRGGAVRRSRPQHDLRRHGRRSSATRATRGCRSTGPASARSCSATTWSTIGKSIST